MLRFALTLIVIVMIVGCGDGVAGSESDHAHEDFHANWERMEASEEWTGAHARFKECMRDLGYPSVDSREGILLKDGTIHKPEVGQSYEVSGAWLEYQLDSQACADSSGVNEVRSRFGTADPMPDAGRMRIQNEVSTKQMQCMAGKGWDIPEPRLLRGALVWDIQLNTDERRQAFTLDQTACNMELFGTAGAPY